MPYIDCDDAYCDGCYNDHWIAPTALPAGSVQESIMSGIQTLRRVTRWADQQDENLWIPPAGPPATITQIVELHALCLAWGVDTPADLRTHDNPKAGQAFRRWRHTRG